MLHYGSRQAIAAVTLILCILVATGVGLAKEKVNLHYFTWATGGAADQIREDFIEPFEELNPHISIEYEAISFGQFFDKLVTYHAGGTAPDLMHMSVGYVYDYAKNGMLLNLQPYFDRDLEPSDFFMEPMMATRYPTMRESDDLYAIPFAFVLSTMFYNKTMFDDLGLGYPEKNWSWYDVRNVGKKLVRDITGDGQPDQWGFHVNEDYKVFDPILHSFGGRTLDEEFNVALLEPKSLEAARFMVNLIFEDQVAPPTNVIGSASAGFREGKIAMILDNISNISGFRTSCGFDWEAALIPTGPEKRVVRLWPDSFAISSQSKHPEEAWSYIKFVITQRKMDRYSGERKVPIYKPLALSKDWLQPDQKPNKMVFIESTLFGDPLEFRPRWGEWNGARGSALRPAFQGQLPIEHAMQNAANAIRNIIADN